MIEYVAHSQKIAKFHRSMSSAITRPLSIVRRKYGVRVRDVFFANCENQIDGRNVDLVYYVQCRQSSPGSMEFYTSIVDLLQAPDALLNGISKNFRYEIRRAEKDALRFHFMDAPMPHQIEEFACFYDAFALNRGIAKANRIKLNEIAKANGLNLAWTYDSYSERTLAGHAYIVDGNRARLYHSGSSTAHEESAPLRQLSGRANKALHWHCMQQYKKLGYQRYDLGGVSLGAALKSIDDFKQQFGGILVKEFNHIGAASLTGRIALAVQYLANQRVIQS